MNSVPIDGHPITGEPIFVTGIYEIAVHLIDQMIEQGKERCTLPIVYKTGDNNAATLISLHRCSTVALNVEGDGDDVAALTIARADADMTAIMTEIKARVAATEV